MSLQQPNLNSNKSNRLYLDSYYHYIHTKTFERDGDTISENSNVALQYLDNGGIHPGKVNKCTWCTVDTKNKYIPYILRNAILFSCDHETFLRNIFLSAWVVQREKVSISLTLETIILITKCCKW